MNRLLQEQSCRRRGPRHRVQRGAFAYRHDGSRSVVALSDVSYEGCQLSGVPGLEPAEAIDLIMPRFGRTVAEVCWSAAGRAGVRFAGETAAEADDAMPRARPAFIPAGIARPSHTFGRRDLVRAR